jgi:putative NADH-flavin reductase
MQLTIFGATGATGQVLVPQALARGDTLTALARDPAKLRTQDAHIRVVQGDVRDEAAVAHAVTGADAVISVLGSTSPILTEGARQIIAAMTHQGVRRLIVQGSLYFSGEYAGMSAPSALLSRLLATIAGSVVHDEQGQARLVRESGLDWVLVQPTRLTNGKRTGHYHAQTRPNGSVTGRIARADVADFLLAAAHEDQWLCQTVALGR